MSYSRRQLIKILFEKIFGRRLMKTKIIKPCGKMTEKNVKHRLSKKRRKVSNHCESGGAVASLITSSSHKRRIASLRFTNSVQRTTAVTKNLITKDVIPNLRATCSEADMQLSNSTQTVGAAIEREMIGEHDEQASIAIPEAELANMEVLSDFVTEEASNGKISDYTVPLRNHEAAAPSVICPSLLETIFSPVFQLFKGTAGEGSASCTSTVEQVEGPDDGIDSAGPTTTEMNTTSAQESKSVSSSCCVTKATANTTVEAAVSMFRVVSAAAFSLSGELNLTSPDDGVLVCQSTAHVGDECLEWMQMDHRPLDETTQAYDHSEEEEMLDTDPASLFLSIQHAKPLHCEDSEGCKEAGEPEDNDEHNDFDPYLFIKHLPDLSEVVSTSRPSLLPRQTRRCPPITLVLDLDETLVHSTLEYCEDADFTFPVHFNLQEHTVYVRCRPYLQVFMERVAQLFEIIVFTASQSIYAEQLLNILDPKRKLIRHRVFRDSCVFVEGNYLKDLTILGRDLSKVAIVDNSPQAFGFQVDNGIPIESWFDDRSDCALAMLLPFLETLVGVDDVRPIIAKKYNLRNKIASALQVPAIASREFLERPCAKVC
ncbi:hypothetical protein O6H91_01G136500 [Diphasiastrum complanatum]|uniref:Uncharacterized protein n=4 Tax=Diphasiastrum complanatum TaxID=34168 RepID=A0ACC2EWH2_DIPCM|nr:hypothetical protein O6H91_01G136500 [Diphasiastrum complanatum]KAJ7570855.1 hypothetical protein O6H91_01G136500 [Diphasiastrum complanatum]KAJ7570859.1 hypothetical protein O6H91_01G136500 [Diphasiastrum complanatum]KAJ7570860.1 hypothetical protein O6H91_01G136500 [Diphasiastrum complanatum]